MATPGCTWKRHYGNRQTDRRSEATINAPILTLEVVGGVHGEGVSVDKQKLCKDEHFQHTSSNEIC